MHSGRYVSELFMFAQSLEAYEDVVLPVRGVRKRVDNTKTIEVSDVSQQHVQF